MPKEELDPPKALSFFSRSFSLIGSHVFPLFPEERGTCFGTRIGRNHPGSSASSAGGRRAGHWGRERNGGSSSAPGGERQIQTYVHCGVPSKR